MQTSQNLPETDPRHYTPKTKAILNGVITHVPEVMNKLNKPKAQALFATTAEVLNGLATAYSPYE